MKAIRLKRHARCVGNVKYQASTSEEHRPNWNSDANTLIGQYQLQVFEFHPLPHQQVF